MRKELLTYQDPKSPVSEVFRTLRTNIQFMSTDKKLETLLVTSTSPGEGKSWVTSNLAVTFAQAGKSVILVDADMRKGRQFNIFGATPKPGLSNYLSHVIDGEGESAKSSVVDYLQVTEVENLHLLVAGSVPPNPSELLVSHKMRSLLKELKKLCDIVIIDGTPCDLVTDSIILSRYVDSTIIVTAQNETKKDNLNRVVKNLKNVGAKIAGVVVNKVEISIKKYNKSYYYGSTSTGSASRSSSSRSSSRNISRSTDREMAKPTRSSLSSSPEGRRLRTESVEKKPQLENRTNTINSSNKEINDFLQNNIEKPKDISPNKVNEIMDLVNNYIVESEKQKKEY